MSCQLKATEGDVSVNANANVSANANRKDGIGGGGGLEGRPNLRVAITGINRMASPGLFRPRLSQPRIRL